MPKIYYRCSMCHKERYKKDIVPDDLFYCPDCCGYNVYKCQHNYWWELLYMKIKSYIRLFINILKILRDSWREFLAVVKYYNKWEKMIRNWRKK